MSPSTLTTIPVPLIFFENGYFLIFSPPDLSIAIFLDTATTGRPTTKDRGALRRGRRRPGDVIPQDGILVLMGGALPFTNMQNLFSENHDDGTYRYGGYH